MTRLDLNNVIPAALSPVEPQAGNVSWAEIDAAILHARRLRSEAVHRLFCRIFGGPAKSAARETTSVFGPGAAYDIQASSDAPRVPARQAAC